MLSQETFSAVKGHPMISFDLDITTGMKPLMMDKPLKYLKEKESLKDMKMLSKAPTLKKTPQ